ARSRQWRLSLDLVERPHHRLLRTRAEPGASGRVADRGHSVECPASDHRISVSLWAHAASDIPTRVNSTMLRLIREMWSFSLVHRREASGSQMMVRVRMALAGFYLNQYLG